MVVLALPRRKTSDSTCTSRRGIREKEKQRKGGGDRAHGNGEKSDLLCRAPRRKNKKKKNGEHRKKDDLPQTLTEIGLNGSRSYAEVEIPISRTENCARRKK